jgi:hypothetical protein
MIQSWVDCFAPKNSWKHFFVLLQETLECKEGKQMLIKGEELFSFNSSIFNRWKVTTRSFTKKPINFVFEQF